eukprot:3596-Amphidinium_carterae.1
MATQCYDWRRPGTDGAGGVLQWLHNATQGRRPDTDGAGGVLQWLHNATQGRRPGTDGALAYGVLRWIHHHTHMAGRITSFISSTLCLHPPLICTSL